MRVASLMSPQNSADLAQHAHPEAQHAHPGQPRRRLLLTAPLLALATGLSACSTAPPTDPLATLDPELWTARDSSSLLATRPAEVPSAIAERLVAIVDACFLHGPDYAGRPESEVDAAVASAFPSAWAPTILTQLRSSDRTSVVTHLDAGVSQVGSPWVCPSWSITTEGGAVLAATIATTLIIPSEQIVGPYVVQLHLSDGPGTTARLSTRIHGADLCSHRVTEGRAAPTRKAHHHRDVLERIVADPRVDPHPPTSDNATLFRHHVTGISTC